MTFRRKALAGAAIPILSVAALALGADAHTGGITFGCRDDKPYVQTNLTSYNGTNTISLVVDGTELTPGTFGSSYVKTFNATTHPAVFDPAVAHTGSYAVKAHDDTGHPEWSPSGPISIPACSSPPPTTGATTSTSTSTTSTTVASTVPPSSAPATSTTLPAADSTSTSVAPTTTTIPCDPATHYVAPSGDCVNLPLCEKEPLAPQCAPLDTGVTPLPTQPGPVATATVPPPPELNGTLPATGGHASRGIGLIAFGALVTGAGVVGLARRPKATKR